MRELIIDNFAGGGGASTGIELAGIRVDIAINHDPEAVAMHAANHPHTHHYAQNIMAVDPRDVVQGRPVGLAWFSPDCKHFSKAKGGKPVEKRIRDLAWVVVHWAQLVQPRVILLENVEEFTTWGPLLEDGRPCPASRGLEFRRWIRELRKAGYKVEWKELRACDYGAPTIRKRLFVIARRDGRPIVWPTPTHGPAGSGLLPYRVAAECIDWSINCPSIFERDRPLAEATCRRIARGVWKYVINATKPFIVPITHTGPTNATNDRCHDIDEPLRTMTAKAEYALVSPSIVGVGGRAGQSRPRGVDEPMATGTSKADAALVEPFVIPLTHQGDERSHQVAEPLRTITGANRGEQALVSPLFIARYGEREGQEPRCRSVEEPIATVVPDANGATMVSAFMAQHNGGFNVNPGHPVEEPLSTITQSGTQQQVVAAWMEQRNKGCTGHSAEEPISTIMSRGVHQQVIASNLMITRNHMDGQANDEPFHTLTGTNHFAEVRAFLTTYYGTEQDTRIDEPLPTATTKDRFAVVTVDGLDYVIVDIGMRMLSPRELFNAQGFPSSYILDAIGPNGKPLTKTAQVRCCGNSVCPPLAEALVRANYVQDQPAVEPGRWAAKRRQAEAVANQGGLF